MDEPKEPAAEIPEQTDGQPEHLIGRRRLLKMLAVAGGATAAAIALPDVWTAPTVEAAELHCPPPNMPVLFALGLDRHSRAHVGYADPLGGVRDDTTLMGVGVANSGQLQFKALDAWGAVRLGTPKIGDIIFRPPAYFCQNGSGNLRVQLQVFPAAWWTCNDSDARTSNTISRTLNC